MTVYVDDWRQRARVGRLVAAWSHLTVGPWDDQAELHDFAGRLGLRRCWYQDKPWPRQHYDVTETRRRQAIHMGAVPVTWRDAGRMMREARRCSQGNPPPPAQRADGVPLTLF